MQIPTDEEAMAFYGSIHLGDMEGEKSSDGFLWTKLNKFGAIAKAGGRAGDLLVVINGKKVADRSFAENMGTLIEAGGVGATVKFGIIRDGEKLVLNVTLKKRRTLDFDVEEADVDLRKIAPA